MAQVEEAAQMPEVAKRVIVETLVTLWKEEKNYMKRHRMLKISKSMHIYAWRAKLYSLPVLFEKNVCNRHNPDLGRAEQEEKVKLYPAPADLSRL